VKTRFQSLPFKCNLQRYTEAQHEKEAAVKSADKAKKEVVAARAAASAAETLLRNESTRAMDEIQAARDAIAAQSKRSSVAEVGLTEQV
jgi:hypothetical protein